MNILKKKKRTCGTGATAKGITDLWTDRWIYGQIKRNEFVAKDEEEEKQQGEEDEEKEKEDEEKKVMK